MTRRRATRSSISSITRPRSAPRKIRSSRSHLSDARRPTISLVRRRNAGLVVDVRKHLEAELVVLVEHLQAARLVVAAIGLEEVRVGEQLFQVLAHAFPAGGAGVLAEGGPAIGDELVEIVSHGVLPQRFLGRLWEQSSTTDFRE